MSEAAFEPAQMSPHTQDGEEGLLGSVLINADAYDEVAPIITKDDFFILRNSWVWEAMTRIKQRGEVLEYLTVIEELRSQKRLNDAGGAAYITYLASNIATSVHAEVYARLVARAAERRRLLKSASEIADLAREEDADIQEVRDRVHKSIDAALSIGASQELVSGDFAMWEYADLLDDLNDGTISQPGIPSSYFNLAQLLVRGGYQPGYWSVVGFTHKGKTTFMLNEALGMARAGYRVGFWSLEMTIQELQAKLFMLESGLSTDQLMALNSEEKDTYKAAVKRLLMDTVVTPKDGSPPCPIMRMFFFSEDRHLSHFTWSSQARAMQRKGFLDIAFIDYIQIMNHISRHKGEPYPTTIGHTVNGVRDTAKALGIPVLVGAQASRASQMSSTKDELFHISDSSQIEKDSDGVLFITDDGDYDGDNLPDLINKRVSVRKQRIPGGKLGKRYFVMNTKTGSIRPGMSQEESKKIESTYHDKF